MTSRRRALLDDLLLVLASTGGGSLFQFAGIPAGWLTGAMIAVALIGTRHRWTAPSPTLSDAGMLLTGVAIGSAATPEAVRLLASNPTSLGLLLISMAATVAATTWVLRRFGGWNRLDAVLASAPGAFSAVAAVAGASNADLQRIVVIQLFRLFMLVAAAPGLLVLTGVGGGGTVLAQPVASSMDMAILLVTGSLAGLAFRKLGIMAPFILGATLASAGLHASGMVTGTLAPPLAIFGFVIIGGMIGSRFGIMSGTALLKLMPLAFAAFVVSAGVGAVFAAVAAHASGVSFGVAFIAFAPGGLEAMALLALLLGLDPLFVGAHHMVRFLAVGLLLPLGVHYLLKRPV